MIITNMADGQVTDDKLIKFNFREIAYTIEGTKGKLEGAVPAQGYFNLDVSQLGNPPFTVTLNYVNDSYRAAPVQVDSGDAMCIFWMAFPAGPNGPRTIVFEQG